MLNILISRSLSTASRPEYLTETKTSQNVNRNVLAWKINFKLFEAKLFAQPQNGQKTRIILPDWNSQYQEYEIEPYPLFARATRLKYPNQLFAYMGNVVGNPDEQIGIVYCFKSLKAYYVNHYQTIEMDKSIDQIVINDQTKNMRWTREHREEIENYIHEHHAVNKEINEVSQDTEEDLFDTSFTDTLIDIKVIKFVPFPTQTYYTNFIDGRGLNVGELSQEVMRKNIFSSLALTTSLLNRIYMPLLSVRFEMQLDLNMITADRLPDSKYNYRSRYIGDQYKDYVIDNKILNFAERYFKPTDIDLGIMLSSSRSRSGLAWNSCFSPHGKKRTGAYALDTYEQSGVIEHLIAHELGHCFSAKHSFTYEGNYQIEATEVGSGVTIMGYPGRVQENNVQGDPYSYFAFRNVQAMVQHIQRNFLTNSYPKANRKPTISPMKTRYVIPTDTAFLLSGSATDPDNDTLYYNWEQIDSYTQVVNTRTYNHDLATGPLIRNYGPTRDSFRFIPKLDRIKSGELRDGKPVKVWESVPSVARTLHFAFTVWDRKMLSGEAGNTDVKIVGIKVVQSAPFAFKNLKTNTRISRGSSQELQWEVGATAGEEINAKTVTIKFASDGINFNKVLAEKVPNNGRYTVTFPNETTSNGRLMIQGDDNIFITINTGDITLN